MKIEANLIGKISGRKSSQLFLAFKHARNKMVACGNFSPLAFKLFDRSMTRVILKQEDFTLL